MNIGRWTILLLAVLGLNVLNLCLWFKLRRITQERQRQERSGADYRSGAKPPC